MAKLLGLFL
jgi:hypothetical protein